MKIGPGKLALAYAAISVLTYGHAAASAVATSRAEQAACRAAEPDGYCSSLDEDMAGVAAAFPAVLWPLYWSWEAWS